MATLHLIPFIIKILFVFLVILSCVSFITCNPSIISDTSKTENVFETFTQQSISVNDGGNTQNNGTLDNGQWIYYGSQQAGTNSRSEKTYLYSLYFEKTVHVLTNWARMSPVGFKSRFGSLFKSGVSLAASGLVPLFEHFNLVESARYHSYDMSFNNCFSHASCNGEDTFVRIATFYTKNNVSY